MQLVLLFPGQGSQAPGMARDLAAAYPAARAVLDEADATLGVPLSALMFDGPEHELTLTHNAQPTLLAHGAAAWAVVREAAAPHVVAAAGHSLGEFTAYHAAGSLALAAAVTLVRRRGELMYEAGARRPGAMAAVLGELTRPIEEICGEAASAAGGIVGPANYNAPAQVVLSGEVGAVERAMQLARTAGAKRVQRLQVSGAFHSPLMEPARAGLEAALDEAGLADPAFPVYANVDARPVTTATAARRALADQLTAPVRWTEEIRAIVGAYPDALYVEMGPGTVASRLVKRIAPGVHTRVCGTAADVDALLGELAGVTA